MSQPQGNAEGLAEGFAVHSGNVPRGVQPCVLPLGLTVGGLGTVFALIVVVPDIGRDSLRRRTEEGASEG